MKAIWLALWGLSVFVWGCSNGSNGSKPRIIPPPPPEDWTKIESGKIIELDNNAIGNLPISLAANGDKMGVAYFAELPKANPQEPAKYELRYVESNQSPQTVDTVEVVEGVSLGFSNGEPVIAYLGGDPGRNNTDNPYTDGADQPSLYWKEGDLAIARRSGENWSVQTPVQRGADINGCAVQVNTEFGDVVGLWPAMAVDSNGDVFVAFRDVHGGQFPTDYRKSFVEMYIQRANSSSGVPVHCQWNEIAGHGGRNSITIADQRAISIAWSNLAEPNDNPTGLYIVHGTGIGTNSIEWTTPKAINTSVKTNTGPSLAWHPDYNDPDFGLNHARYGIAYENAEDGIVYYLQSRNGTDWEQPEAIEGSGAARPIRYPSLVFNSYGDPLVIYSTYANAHNKQESLMLAQRRPGDGIWSKHEIDPQGGHHAKAVYLPSGKVIVAYKDTTNTKLKLAIVAR
jgi:hypothetical protein